MSVLAIQSFGSLRFFYEGKRSKCLSTIRQAQKVIERIAKQRKNFVTLGNALQVGCFLSEDAGDNLRGSGRTQVCPGDHDLPRLRILQLSVKSTTAKIYEDMCFSLSSPPRTAGGARPGEPFSLRSTVSANSTASARSVSDLTFARNIGY